MLLLSTISITFSYEDLVTLAYPPEYDYQEAYENYKAAFENAKENVLENLSNDTGSAHLVSEELLKVQDTLKEIEKQLEYKRNELDTLTEPNRTNRNTTIITSENGKTIITVENETTDELKLGLNDEYDIQCGYEAGYLGYSLYNQLTAAGVRCVILSELRQICEMRI